MKAAAGEVEIRRMSAADVGRVMEIAAGLQDAPHWPESAYVGAIDPQNSPTRIALIAAQKDASAAIGFVIAQIVAPEAEVETIAVAADGQRRGVGRLLVEALVQELTANSMSKLMLEVRESNQTARRFYESLGFNRNGKRLLYYADPVEDALLLELDLG